MIALDDGMYDAMIIDGEIAREGGVRLELVITSGEYKGHVVAVRASGFEGDAVDVLGLPCTLTVEGGEPRVTLQG